MALATLFQDIGVNDAAEAKAVIYKILNKKTSDLTPQQQGMLGTGIYRDISDELDILDAAGNPITRTSTVTLPSGEKMESKFSASPAAGDAPQNNNVQQDNNAEEDSEPLSREEQLWALLDYISNLSDDEFAEVMGYDDKSSMFNAWSRIGSGYTPYWAAERLDDRMKGETGWTLGNIRWDLFPPLTNSVLTQDMVIQAILDDLNRRIGEEVVDPNEEDTDLTGSKTADELQFDEIITASTGFVQDPETMEAIFEAWKTGAPLDEGLNAILQKHLIEKGGIGVEFQGKTPDFLLLTIPGLPALASGDISKISLKNPDGSYRTVAEVTGDIRGSLEATVRQIGEIPGKIRDKINELLDAEDIEGALEVMEGNFTNEENIGPDGCIIKTPPRFTVELIGELKDLFGSLSGKWKEGDEDVTSWMGNPFPKDPTEIITEKPTEIITESPTEKPTEIITEAPTEVITEPPNEPPTEAPTSDPVGPPEENGGGGGGGGGMFSGGDQYFDQANLAYNPFNPVLYPDKDYNVALDRIMFENLTSPATKRESLFGDFDVA